ncbi:hypothetical protein GE061_015537 [Apolygus lucorum]|uniref:Spermatogenesis-associated protein 6 N-terminal domain-containing protein n=1 Tax=Apolygus lucorum TaxID=248454 RepID=A0A6A4JQ53_APOLU|nr:hypothetical protein GE061_015537 [Apolygus lucorum]
MSKLYNVSIYLDINTVSCPGVWLCPKGKAFLKICLFGVSDLTKEVDPFFPLIFKERFHFQKVFKNINSVYELHDKLGRSIISLELLQCPIGSAGCVKLALFNALLSDILHPYTTCFSKPLHTSGLELLFTTCKVFPGIIAPKADVSTKVMVTDTLGGGRSVKVLEMRSRAVDDEKKRQNKVCHTKNNTNCRCFQTKDDPIKNILIEAHHPEESAESEGSLGTAPNRVKQSGRGRVDLNELDRMGDANARSATGDPYNRNRVSRVGRGEGSVLSDLRQNGRRKDEHHKRETIRQRTDMGDVGEGTSLVSREEGVHNIDVNTLTTAPDDHASDGQNFISKNEKKSREDRRYLQDMFGAMTPYYGGPEEPVLGRDNVDRRRGKGDLRQQKKREDKYEMKKMTSCEKFLQEHDFEEIKRTNDKLLRERYFRCYKERHGDKEAPSYDNLEEMSSLMNIDENEIGRVPQKSTKDKECGECTCLKSYKKKLKKKRKDSRNLQHRAFPYGDNYGKEEDGVGIRQEFEGGAMPPRFGYEERFEGRREPPQRVRSRSNVELYSQQMSQRQDNKKIRDPNYNKDQREWKPRDLQGGAETLPRSGYREQSREYHEPSQFGSVKPFGRTSNAARPTSVPKTQEDRVRSNDWARASRQYEPDLGEIHTPKTPKTQPESRNIDDRNRRDDRPTVPSDRADTVPRAYNQPARPTYEHERKQPEIQPVSSESEESSSGEECKCSLCKNYQETYKPKTHPCPRFRKTAGTFAKLRQSKSNTGPKKVIPSRRSTITKTYKGASKKLKTNSEDHNECGFANCDTLDHDFIGNKKDIRKFYGSN